jgi:hypothetical protein
MRMMKIALCTIFVLLLSAPAHLPLLGSATAQTQPKPQAQSREALYVKCRNAIFRKHGQPGVQYNHGPRYLVLPYTAGSWIDKCVASGGRDY